MKDTFPGGFDMSRGGGMMYLGKKNEYLEVPPVYLMVEPLIFLPTYIVSADSENTLTDAAGNTLTDAAGNKIIT